MRIIFSNRQGLSIENNTSLLRFNYRIRNNYSAEYIILEKGY